MKNLLFVVFCLAFLISCKYQGYDRTEIKPDQIWVDIGVDINERITYKVIKIEDNHVFTIDSKGIVHRVHVTTFREYCILKEEIN